jgi:hypothetical protein
MFKPAKKVSGGYKINLKEPLEFKLSLFCPFGIDVETDWKWSMKLYVPIRPDSSKQDDRESFSFLEKMQQFENEIGKYLKQQFPSTFKEYFVIQTFMPATHQKDIEWVNKNGNIDSGCFFRIKIPIDKHGVADTSYTGSGEHETTRTLVPDDIKCKSRVTVDIRCDGWWITDTKNGMSVGYTFTLQNIIQL